MTPWIKLFILLITFTAIVAGGRKDDRIQLSELFQQLKPYEPCNNNRRSSSEYCTDDDADDKTLDYIQNVDKNSEPDKDEQRNSQFSTMLTEYKSSSKKRTGTSFQFSCDCLVKYEIIDLGHGHYPRYLISAVCKAEEESRINQKRCWPGSRCKPAEYKMKVLTRRTRSEMLENDISTSSLPETLRSDWKFKTVTVTVGCNCSY